MVLRRYWFQPDLNFQILLGANPQPLDISGVIVAQRGLKVVDAAFQTRKPKMPGAVREGLDALSLDDNQRIGQRLIGKLVKHVAG